MLSSHIIKGIKKIIKNEFVLETIGVTLSAQIMLIPIIAYYFNNISLISLLTNFIVVPISGTLTILGIITVLINIISIKLASILAYAIYAIISFIIFIARLFGNLSFAQLLIPTPKIWMIVLYYFLIYIFLFLKRERKFFLKSIVLILSFYFILSKIPKNYIKLNMIDVGQGDSFYIETTKGKVILIDGGGSESSDYDVGANIVLPYLLDKGKTTIDLIIVSHPHEDHIEGIITVLENLTVKNIIIGKNIEKYELTQTLIKICERKGVNLKKVSEGDSFSLDNLFFEVIYPDDKIIENNINNMSLIIKMEYRGIKTLFTGDIEELGEKELKGELNAHILKVSHHGANTSTKETFLRKVSPKISLISVGENNSYGHPSKNVIERLKKSEIYRTDKMGEVKIKIYKNGKIKIRETL